VVVAVLAIGTTLYKYIRKQLLRAVQFRGRLGGNPTRSRVANGVGRFLIKGFSLVIGGSAADPGLDGGPALVSN
jgi:hypothetical protein